MKSINVDGKNYFELTTNNRGEIQCPFCGKKHKHGTPSGHRIAHCTGSDYSYVVFFEGKQHKQRDGYYIRHVQTF